MGLPPVRPLPTSSHVFNGEEVHFRSLSRAEALHLQTFAGREDEGELYMLMCAFDATREDAEAFSKGSTSKEVSKLMVAIAIFSDLASEATIEAARQRGELPDTIDPK